MYLILFIILVWIASSAAFALNALFLPEAQGVASSFLEEIESGGLFLHTSITVGRVFLGVFGAVLIGIPLGLLLGRITLFRKQVLPVLEFLRGIPATMLFPILIITFGFGELSRSLITLYVTIPIIAIGTMVGVLPRAENVDKRNYLKVHEKEIPFIYRATSVLWDAIPSIIGSLKIAISISLVVVIVTEMFFVASSGIGWAAFRAYEVFAVDKMWMYIILIGLISFAFNKILDFAYSKVAHQSV